MRHLVSVFGTAAPFSGFVFTFNSKSSSRIYPYVPEGNFGGNQLLDGSISLSPLYPDLTIDLHVRIATDLHQSFLWLHPIQA